MSGGVRKTNLPLRITFVVTGVVVVLGGVQMYILTENTEKYFAWTILVPVSSAVLGAYYFTAAPLLFMYAAQRTWARTRALMPGGWVAVTLLLIMTLTHLDEFHLQSDDPASARTAAIIWFVVYVSVPILFAVLWWVQTRIPGVDPPRVERLPAWLKAYFTAVAVVFFVLGLGLYFLPATMADLWPWPLAELSSMAIGSWCIGLGMVMGYATLIDDDLDRFFVPAASFALLGAWHLTAILRYPDDIDFGNVLMWLDLLLYGSIVPAGIYGAIASLRVRRRTAPVPPPPEQAIPAMP